MVRIRLSRMGLKRQPTYRIVVIEGERARDSRCIESIGFYNPRTQPETVTIKEDRALYWLSVGAQPSDPVKHMLTRRGTYDRLQRLHKGESLDSLAAEAQPIEAEVAKISPKTHFLAPIKSAKNAAQAE
jgi:small subunit ribosomal protein S16